MGNRTLVPRPLTMDLNCCCVSPLTSYPTLGLDDTDRRLNTHQARVGGQPPAIRQDFGGCVNSPSSDSLGQNRRTVGSSAWKWRATPTALSTRPLPYSGFTGTYPSIHLRACTVEVSVAFVHERRVKDLCL